MKYESTRDNLRHFTFEEALCSGYAPDGGLFVPSELPSITLQEHLLPWSKLTFPALAYEVLRMFISQTEVSDSELKAVCRKSFSEEEFDNENFVPVIKVGSVYISELFHGPTFCFKDLGMRPVINLLSHFVTLRNQPTTLLVSTTGDTGPAAVHAVGDTGNPLLSILVHYPKGQISEFQRKSLTTVDSKCVKIVSFEGGGDDMDRPIKETLLFNKSDVGRKRSFCGINSYNIGRPLAQIVHFIWTYLRVVEKLEIAPGDEKCRVDVILPTGAMGNMAGGYMAKKMGLPIGLLCAGVNVNDITHRVFERGEFHKKKIQKTLSDAINIEVPYNFERILFYLTNGQRSVVKDCMDIMEQTQKLTLDETLQKRLQLDFRSARITDDEMCHALHRTFDKFNYLADPHTSVAISAAEKLGYPMFENSTNESKSPVVILATASPCKFEEAVTAAIGKKEWENCREKIFTARAQLILKKNEIEPYHFLWRSGATLHEVQSEWKIKMLDIVEDNF